MLSGKFALVMVGAVLCFVSLVSALVIARQALFWVMAHDENYESDPLVQGDVFRFSLSRTAMRAAVARYAKMRRARGESTSLVTWYRLAEALFPVSIVLCMGLIFWYYGIDGL